MKLQNVSRQLTAACRYSYNRLALNYDMYYEICGRENGPGEPPVREYRAGLFLRGGLPPRGKAARLFIPP